MKTSLLKGLTPEQIQKVKACKNHDEILKLAKQEGIELSDEQLAAVSGGGLCQSTQPAPKCPHCNSTDTAWRNLGPMEESATPYKFQCNSCLKVF